MDVLLLNFYEHEWEVDYIGLLSFFFFTFTGNLYTFLWDAERTFSLHLFWYDSMVYQFLGFQTVETT